MTATVNPLLDLQNKVLRATFIHNMAILKKEMPEVYEFYKNYTPTRVALTFDDAGNVNLMANGKMVYQGNPLVESRRQVEKFIEDPTHIRYQIADTGSGFYEHEKVIHKIVQKREAEVGKGAHCQLTENDQLDFVAFMGTGLGYHLESLFKKFAIRSALIYEPDPDCFYATLHSIDIEKLVENCRKNGGQLIFKIGGDSAAFVNEISSTFSRRGYFNISHMYLYRHYFSDKTFDAYKKFHDLAYRYVSGWGFCEDEVIGISHTLTNIAIHKFPSMLASVKRYKRELPIFIIGTGPSLDNSLAYLKANQGNAIIMSCGTALKPLLDNGVIPDIHIEQERPVSIYKWVKKVGHEDKLKEMDIICLNTVYPGILKLFKQAYVMLKPKDAGTAFIQESISEKYAEVSFCNPTVTNAGTAAAVALGFKNITLFGIDYGFKSEEHHHSKDSIYFKEVDNFKMKGHFKVPGNFGGDVFTNPVFDRSRMNLEMLLQHNPEINCINTCDGAKIQRSTACQLDDLPDFSVIKEKSSVVQDLLKVSFDSKGYINRDLTREFEALLPKFKGYIRKLSAFTVNTKSRIELSEAFTAQYVFMNDIEHNRSKKLFHRFLNGSLNYMQSTIMSNVYYYTEREQQEEYIQFCLTTMNEHLNWLLDDLSENYNKPAKA